MLVQLILTLGFALILSALTVHFRDLRDILSNLLTFWFFATPIIYPVHVIFEDPNPADVAGDALKLNPFTHLAITYQEILFFDGPVGHCVAGCSCSARSRSSSSCSATSCSTGCAIRLRRKCDARLRLAARASSSAESMTGSVEPEPEAASRRVKP